MRTITAPQEAILGRRDTEVVYLIDLGDGAELLSTRGDRTVGDRVYVGGEVGLRRASDWSEATISFSPSPARIAWQIGGAWRGSTCKISQLPAANFEYIVAPGYWDEDYAFAGPVQGDPIDLMPGVLVAATTAGNGRPEFTAVHEARTVKWSPSSRVGPPWANHLPRPGETITWGSIRFTVGGR